MCTSLSCVYNSVLATFSHSLLFVTYKHQIFHYDMQLAEHIHHIAYIGYMLLMCV